MPCADPAAGASSRSLTCCRSLLRCALASCRRLLPPPSPPRRQHGYRHWSPAGPAPRLAFTDDTDQLGDRVRPDDCETGDSPWDCGDQPICSRWVPDTPVRHPSATMTWSTSATRTSRPVRSMYGPTWVPRHLRASAGLARSPATRPLRLTRFCHRTAPRLPTPPTPAAGGESGWLGSTPRARTTPPHSPLACRRHATGQGR